LIELLVVIAVLSLLVSILMPSLQRAQELAKAVVCMSSLRNVGMAETLYAADNDGWMGYSFHYTNAADNWLKFLTGGKDPYWVTPVYVENTETFGCPALSPTGKEGGKYGMNTYAVSDAEMPGVRVTWTDGVSSCGLQFVNPGEGLKSRTAFMLADTCTPASRRQGGNFSFYKFAGGGIGVGSGRQAMHLRHLDRVNVLFWDGHLEAVDEDHLLDYGCLAYVRGDWSEVNPYVP